MSSGPAVPEVPWGLASFVLTLLDKVYKLYRWRRDKGRRRGGASSVLVEVTGGWAEAHLELGIGKIEITVTVAGVNPAAVSMAKGGAASLRAGKFSEALSQFEGAERNGLASAELHNLKAIALMRLNRSQESLQEATRAHQLKPDNPDILVNLGNAYRAVGDRRKALTTYRKVLKANPRSIHAMYDIANVYREAGKFNLALEFYDQALAVDHTRSDVWNNRALPLIELGRLDEAEGSLKRAIELWPKHEHAKANLGRLVGIQGRYQEGLQLADDALTLNPDFLEALHVRGFCLLRLGKLPEAADTYSEILKRKPNDGAAMAKLGAIHIRQGDTKGAEAHFDRALQSGYRDASVYVDLGVVRIDQGRYPEALRLSIRALLSDPPPAVEAFAYRNFALYLYQWFLWRKSKAALQAAAVFAERSIKLNPDLAESWNVLGACLFDLGDREEAGAAFERAVQLRPTHPVFRSNLDQFRLSIREGRRNEH